MGFIQVLSYIILSIIWTSLSMLSIIIYICFPHDLYYWDKIYDKCDPKSAKHQYIIRFIFGTFKKDFNISKTTISIDIRRAKTSLIQLQISPQQLEQSVPKSESTNQKVVRFILYRKEPLLDISHIEINHNGSGSINVTTIEIQDMNSNEANIAYIGQPINSLSKDKCGITQRYPSAHKEHRSIESGLKPKQTLTSLEFILFFFVSIDIILLMCVMIIPCNEDDTKLCADYRKGFLSSLYSGLVSSFIAALVFIFLVLIYRFVIKNLNSKNSGKGFWSFIKTSYLLMLFITGVISGVLAAFFASTNNKFPINNIEQDFNHEIYWLFGVVIAIVLFLLFWVSGLSVIGYLIGFFTPTEEAKVDSGLRKSNELGAQSPTVRTVTSKENEDSQDYYNTLMTGNTKVKSISQYMGVQQQSKSVQKSKAKSASSESPSTKPTAKSTADKSTLGVSKTKSTESTGSGYFQQLMQKGQGKVKSVSQYQGVGK